MNKGIEQKRLTATAYGALRPVIENNTPENKRKNRRVELTITKDVVNN